MSATDLNAGTPIEASLLDPRSTWSNPETYDRKAQELAQMFRDNFEKFDEPELAQAGPRF